MISTHEHAIIATIAPTGPRMKLSPREVMAALSGGADLETCLHAEQGSLQAQRAVNAAIANWQYAGLEKSITPTITM